MRNITNNLSLSKKYIFSNILIVLIPCFILSAAVFFRFQTIIRNEIGASYEQVMDQYVANINYKLNLYRNIEETFSVNGIVQDILWEPDTSTPMDLMNLINKFSKETKSIFLGKNQEEVHSFALYTYSNFLPTDGEFLKNIEYAKEEEWYTDIKRSNNFSKCYFKMNPQSKQQLLMMFQPIIKINMDDYTKRLGIIQISLYANRVFKPTDGISKGKGIEVFILDSREKTVYGDIAKESEIRELVKGNAGNKVIKYPDTNKIVVTRIIPPYGLKAVALFSYNEVNSKVRAFVDFSLLIILAILIISFSMTILFSRIFTKRIHLLIGKMKKVEAGDLNITSEINGNDEVGKLDRQFNIMTRQLNSLISENYIERLKKREAELSALQLQINPHFLYNTLESISAIAAINDCYDICGICRRLGDMFRYNINSVKNEFVYLSDEINHIKNYVYIQDVRFDGRFEVRYDIPDALMNCKVLKFILQPIVENALSHGLDAKDGNGRITISAEIQDKILRLCVEDDGLGMPAEKVIQLNESFCKNDMDTDERAKKSIGLKNVNSRIKMINGDIYGVTVESRLNEWTRVVVALPYILEGQEDGYVQITGS